MDVWYKNPPQEKKHTVNHKPHKGESQSQSILGSTLHCGAFHAPPSHPPRPLPSVLEEPVHIEGPKEVPSVGAAAPARHRHRHAPARTIGLVDRLLLLRLRGRRREDEGPAGPAGRRDGPRDALHPVLPLLLLLLRLLLGIAVRLLVLPLLLLLLLLVVMLVVGEGRRRRVAEVQLLHTHAHVHGARRRQRQHGRHHLDWLLAPARGGLLVVLVVLVVLLLVRLGIPPHGAAAARRPRLRGQEDGGGQGHGPLRSR